MNKVIWTSIVSSIATTVLIGALFLLWNIKPENQVSVFGATILTTNTTDTINTFRTNVNTSLTNLNNELATFGVASWGTNANFVYLVTSTNQVGIGATTTNVKLFVQGTAAASTTVIFQGMAAQTGDLFRINNDAGVVLYQFSSAGFASSGATSTFNAPVVINSNATGSSLFSLTANRSYGAGTELTTDGAINVQCTGNTSLCAQFYTNEGADTNSPVVLIRSDNTAYDDGLLWLLQDGTGGNAFNAKLQGPVPQIEFVEADQTTPAGKFELGVNGDFLYVAGRNGADSSFDNWYHFKRPAIGGGFAIGSSTPIVPFNVQGLPATSATSSLVFLGNNTLIGSNAQGTILGFNSTPYTGNFLDFQTNSTTQFSVSATGTAVFAGSVGATTVSSTNLTALNLTLANANEYRTRAATIIIVNPDRTITPHNSTTLSFVFNVTTTLQDVQCYSQPSGTSTIQFNRRNSGTPGTAGTNLLTSNLTCGTSNASTTAFDSSTIPTGTRVHIELVTVAGAPSSTTIFVNAINND